MPSMPGGRLRRGRVAAGLLTAVAAAAAGVLVAMSNLVGLAVVLGMLTLILAVRLDPKRLAVAGLIAVLLSRTVEIATAWGPTTYIDEIVTAYLVIVLVGRRLLGERSVRWPPGIGMFAAFVALGALSSIVSAVPLGVASAGGVLVVKGVLLYFALAQVDWTVDDIGWLARTAAWVLVAALVCALINLVVPTQWAAVFANTGRPQYRSIFPSLIGPFTHPLQFGNFMSLAAIACAAPLLYRARVKGGRTMFAASAVAALLSFRRTAVVGLVAGLSFLVLRRRHAGVLLTALLLVPIAGIVLFPVIQQVVSATYDNFVVGGAENARTRMTVDSVALAFQHFPFGVGFGRFGSAIARENYSIEYVKLGYDAVYGLGSPGNPNNHGRFLTDTQWPAIVGEAGIVGAVFFALGLWRIVTTFRKASVVAHLPLSLLGITGLGWSVHILLESFAYPVFVTSPTSPMIFGLAAITYVVLTGPRVGAASPEASAPVRDARGVRHPGARRAPVPIRGDRTPALRGRSSDPAQSDDGAP